MRPSELEAARMEVVKTYFHEIDGGGAGLLDLLTDDIEVYFPKYGIGHGKADFMELAKGLMDSLQSMKHDVHRMKFHFAGDYLIVEGYESGVLKDGTPWPAAGRSEGRFANVFGFRKTLISRLYIYVDPDFASTHEERFLWGPWARIPNRLQGTFDRSAAL